MGAALRVGLRPPPPRRSAVWRGLAPAPPLGSKGFSFCMRIGAQGGRFCRRLKRVVVPVFVRLLYGCCTVVGRFFVLFLNGICWVGAGQLYTATGEPSRVCPCAGHAHGGWRSPRAFYLRLRGCGVYGERCGGLGGGHGCGRQGVTSGPVAVAETYRGEGNRVWPGLLLGPIQTACGSHKETAAQLSPDDSVSY